MEEWSVARPTYYYVSELRPTDVRYTLQINAFHKLAYIPSGYSTVRRHIPDRA